MGALDGLKVADFSWVGAGPRATKDLSDNGATVIKIESRKRLDLGRRSPPFGGDSSNPDASAFFAQTNTGKKSVTINLGDPRGIELARKLVAWADVVVENFGPGYMDRIGLGYDACRGIRPDIIYASVSVAGRTGPMAGFRGYGNSAAAQSGHAAMTGWPGSEPHMPPFAYGDVIAPMFATVAILAGLEHRTRTGQGQHLDISQTEPMVQVIADLFAADGTPEKPANSDPLTAPHDVFPSAGVDRWIAISAETDAQWEALCVELGAPELIGDSRFASAAGRRAAAGQLAQRIGELTAQHEADELAERLQAAGVPAAPVLDGKTIFESAALREAGHFVACDHPVLGISMMPAPPMRFSETSGEVRRAPLLGEHNAEVFVDLLGLDDGQLAALTREGVLA